MIAGKIKSSYIIKEVRFNSGYFFNDDAVNSRFLEKHKDKCSSLDTFAEVWNPPIFKRQFCQKTEKAVPYCQSSDVTNALEGSDIYINKAQAEKVGAIVKTNQILVTGFGTIGNTRLINELSNGTSYANNACRIESKDKLKSYFLYAFLASKYGRSQLNKNASGSVVRYIEAPGIKKTLIPNLTNAKTQIIQELILKSTELHVKANNVRNEYISLIEKWLDLRIDIQNNHPKYYKKTISEIGKISINSWNHSPYYENIKSTIKRHKYINLKDCCIDNGIFLGKLFKRIPSVKKYGYELISQRDLVNRKTDGRFISGKSVNNVNDYFVEKKSIIIAAVGATDASYTFGVGHFVYKNYENKFINPDTLRIIPDDKIIIPGYLFGFLDTKIGKMLFHSCTYGTKLIRFVPELLDKLPVFLPEEEKQKEIDQMVLYRYDLVNESLALENQAIDLIEKEIESWQK